jgi:hypothetical protein
MALRRERFPQVSAASGIGLLVWSAFATASPMGLSDFVWLVLLASGIGLLLIAGGWLIANAEQS